MIWPVLSRRCSSASMRMVDSQVLLTIVNKTWESTIRIDADEQRRDKTGQIMVRVNELARRVATHPNKLLSTLISSGASSACYDGQYFFDTDHSEGDSGTQ